MEANDRFALQPLQCGDFTRRSFVELVTEVDFERDFVG
jgi:hypothetical protein